MDSKRHDSGGWESRVVDRMRLGGARSRTKVSEHGYRSNVHAVHCTEKESDTFGTYINAAPTWEPVRALDIVRYVPLHSILDDTLCPTAWDVSRAEREIWGQFTVDSWQLKVLVTCRWSVQSAQPARGEVGPTRQVFAREPLRFVNNRSNRTSPTHLAAPKDTANASQQPAHADPVCCRLCLCCYAARDGCSVPTFRALSNGKVTSRVEGGVV